MTALALTLSPPQRRMPAALAGVLWGSVAVAIWGVYLAFARANVASGVLPADLTFVRYMTAGLVMLPYLARRGVSDAGGVSWSRAIALAMLAGPLFLLASASGFRFAPLAHGAVLQPAALTIGGLLLSAAVLGDRLTRWRIAGTAIIVAGLILIAGPGVLSGGVGALRGDALFALAGGMWALFAVLSRRWNVAPMAATAAVAVISAAVYSPVYLATRGVAPLLAQPLSLLAEQVVVQGVLSGIVAVFAFGRAVELLGAARAAALPALVPVVATLIGIPVTGELPGSLQVAGLVVVTLGLFATQRSTLRNGDLT